jgi:hypothetical protein
MKMERALSVLDRQARAQSAMLQECRRRAFWPGDPKPRSAWIDAFVTISGALAETCAVLGRLERCGRLSPELVLLLGNLRLPALPPLPPADEGPHPLRKSAKQPQAECPIEAMAYPPPLGFHGA